MPKLLELAASYVVRWIVVDVEPAAFELGSYGVSNNLRHRLAACITIGFDCLFRPEKLVYFDLTDFTLKHEYRHTTNIPYTFCI
jgi:hypothetical protein